MTLEIVTSIKSVIMISACVTVKIRKNIIHAEKGYIWNPATRSSKNGKYLATIIDDSVITWDEIIEKTKTVPTNFNENSNL